MRENPVISVRSSKGCKITWKKKMHGKKLKPSELANDIASPQTRYILFLIVGGDGVKLKILGRKTSSSFNYYTRMT